MPQRKRPTPPAIEAAETELRGPIEICAEIDSWGEIEAVEGQADKKLPTFKMLAYTGGPMKVTAYYRPVVIDLAGLKANAPIPVLKNHDPNQIVGHGSPTVSAKELRIDGVVSACNEHAREVAESSRNGFPWQASVGATPTDLEFLGENQKTVVNGQAISGPTLIARKSVLGEVSFVPRGADRGTRARVAASQPSGDYSMTLEQWIEAQGFSPATLSPDHKASLEAAYDSVKAILPPTRPGTPPPPKKELPEAPDPLQAAEATTKAIRAAAAAETGRVARINEICAKAPGLKTKVDGREVVIQAHAIEHGWDEKETELHVLRASRPSGPAIHVRGGSLEEATPAVIEAALCLNHGMPEEKAVKLFAAPTMEAASRSEMRGFGLHALMYAVISAAGRYVRPGQVDNDTIRAAFEADATIRADGGGVSTLSLSGILSNLANKFLLAAYQATGAVWDQFCSIGDLNDFKQASRYRMTGNGIFEKVGPDGELKHMQLTDETYTNQLDTYGKIVALTRQMMINDDLGAFLQIPKIIGRQAAIALEQAVFTLLLANANSFFGTGNKNYISGATTNLQVTSLTTAIQKFRDQVDSGKNPILLRPAILLVPTTIETVAEVLMTSQWLNEAATSGTPQPAQNPHVGKFRPVASTYLNAQGLTGSSDTAWYLLSDPADTAIIQVGFLRGRRVPVIESSEADFDTLGMKWRGYHDFGVATEDFRAGVKSKGAA